MVHVYSFSCEFIIFILVHELGHETYFYSFIENPYSFTYLDRGVPNLGDLPSWEGGVMCGNLAGDGSNEGVSTEKRF